MTNFLFGIEHFPRGYIDGFIISNAADADHDISIVPGLCKDANNSCRIALDSPLVKRIDANWAEGINQGGFPSGLGLAVDTWYHFYIIMKADGTVDAGFDTSLTATNLLADATNYIYYRRVGSVLTDGASNIIQFFQYADGNFLWKDPPLDYNAAAPGLNLVTVTLSVPIGVRVLAKANFSLTGPGRHYFKTTDVDDEVTSATLGPLATAGWTAAGQEYFYVEIITNLASQINFRLSSDRQTYGVTIGWQDFRGKDE